MTLAAQAPTVVTARELCAANRWTPEQLSAARALCHPEGVRRITSTLHEGGARLVWMYDAPHSAEWRQRFSALVAPIDPWPVSFAAKGGAVAQIDLLWTLSWRLEDLASARDSFNFPRSHMRPLADFDGVARAAAHFASHEVDRWLDLARMVVGAHR